MTYPYSTLATPISDATTATPTAHSGHHNSVHTALNDLLTELGTDPAGGAASLTARLTTLDTQVVPAGGTAGQVLTKDTGTDYDTSWATPSTGGTTLTASTQTASYVLVLGDAGTCVEMNVASANTLTVPPNSSVAFPTGTVIEIHQYGAGQTTLTPGSGVTIRSDGAKLKLTAQYASCSLRKRATDEWVAAGDLAT